MKDYKWFFDSVEEHVKGFNKHFQEEIDGYSNSIAEHSKGLEILTAANACPNIRKQFKTIIERHTAALEEREKHLRGANESFAKVLSLKTQVIDKKSAKFIDAMAAILQLTPPEETDKERSEQNGK